MAQKKKAKPAKKAAKPAPKKAAAKAKPAKKLAPAAKKAAPKMKPAAVKKAAPKKAAPKKAVAKKAAPKAKPAAKKKPAAPAKTTASKAKTSAKRSATPASTTAAATPVGPADVTRYRSALENKRRQLIEDLSKNHAANLESSDEGIQDIADKASSSYTREFLYTLSDSERQILLLIDEALARMASGSFAVCVACGGPVNRARLDAVPWARHCLSCQELQERGLL